VSFVKIGAVSVFILLACNFEFLPYFLYFLAISDEIRYR
jgi:hypothetical protein